MPDHLPLYPRAAPGAQPPRLGPGAPPQPVARWRSWIALAFLTGYILLPILLGGLASRGSSSALPSRVGPVLLVVGFELALFTVIFVAACVAGRPSADELWLRWPRDRWWIPRAFAWSLGLRLGVGLLVAAGVVTMELLSGMDLERLAEMRPRVESLLDPAALRDPWYFLVMLTLVSFVLAGLREELWRAGMLAMMGRVAPRWFGGTRGPWLALVPVAFLFGAAHFPQGPVGVVLTGLLGLGLGAVMLLHRSVWDAVVAHGFFNASTFVLLPFVADRLSSWPP